MTDAEVVARLKAAAVAVRDSEHPSYADPRKQLYVDGVRDGVVMTLQQVGLWEGPR